MSKVLWAAVCSSLFALSGCGDSGGAMDGPDRDATSERDTVFDPMVDTLGKAEAAGEHSDSRMDDLNRQLEESE